VPVLDKHVNWALQAVGAPEIEESEFKDIEDKKAEIKEQFEKPAQQTEDEPAEKEKDEPAEEQNEEPVIKKNTEKTFLREMTARERAAGIDRMDEEIREKEELYATQLSAEFTTAINAILDEVKRSRMVERRRIEKINSLQIKNSRQIQKTVTNMMTAMYSYGKSTVKAQEYGLATDEVAKWMQEFSFFVSSTEGEQILKTIKPVIFEGIRSGKSYNDIATMAKQALDSYNLDVDGNRIMTTVRTVIAKSFSEGRKQQFEELGDEIKAYEFSAIADSRTSTLCLALDGKKFRPEELDKYNPPLHFNCRSVVIPIFKDEEFEGFDDMPATENTGGDFLELKK
jgi:SPP1 gp7 family putative phage head morphogenesis protein